MNKAFFLLLMAVCTWCSQALAQPKENRVALVVGNGAYKSAPLRNPTNDAKDMATKLKGMGFMVIERNNLTVKQIGSTLREFRSKLTPGSVALVFYAGHGLQIKGENYLPAVDADINGEEDVPTQSLAMRQIMDVLENAKTRLNLVFLDACRNNPYARSFRSGADGLNRGGFKSEVQHPRFQWMRVECCGVSKSKTQKINHNDPAFPCRIHTRPMKFISLIFDTFLKGNLC